MPTVVREGNFCLVWGNIVMCLDACFLIWKRETVIWQKHLEALRVGPAEGVEEISTVIPPDPLQNQQSGGSRPVKGHHRL